MMRYFPDNWADEVHVDESRLLVGEAISGKGEIKTGNITIIMRILKPGAKLIILTRGNGKEAIPALRACGASSVIIERRWVDGLGEIDVFVLTK